MIFCLFVWGFWSRLAWHGVLDVFYRDGGGPINESTVIEVGFAAALCGGCCTCSLLRKLKVSAGFWSVACQFGSGRRPTPIPSNSSNHIKCRLSRWEYPISVFFFFVYVDHDQNFWKNGWTPMKKNISTIFWSGWTFRTPPKNRPGHQLLEALSHWWAWHFGNDGWFFFLWMDKILLLVTIWNIFLNGVILWCLPSTNWCRSSSIHSISSVCRQFSMKFSHLWMDLDC